MGLNPLKVRQPLSLSICPLLKTFAVWTQIKTDRNSQKVCPDPDPNCLTLMVFLKEFFENVNFENKSVQMTKSMQNYPARKEITQILYISKIAYISVTNL